MNENTRFIQRDRRLHSGDGVGFVTAAFCEIENFCRGILRSHWRGIPIYGDIHKLSIEHIRLLGIDIICGGFPCQDISTAGKGVGLNGTRSGLWWQMRRVIDEIRPRWLFIENVPALRIRGADEVLFSLEELGYTCWPLVVGAWAVGAPHQRNRAWIVGYTSIERGRPVAERSKGEYLSNPDRPSKAMANAESSGWSSRGGLCRNEEKESRPSDSDFAVAHSNGFIGTASALERRCPMVATESECKELGSDSEYVAHANGDRIREQPGRISRQSGQAPFFDFPNGPGPDQKPWEEPRTIESQVGGSTDGVSRRLAIKALGNAVVPQVVACIGACILVVNELLEEKR